jgi:hypothetical protein
MAESARDDRVLARLEAEFRVADPGLTALFDAFASRTPAPGAPPRRDAGQGHWAQEPAKRLVTALLVPLIVMAVLVALSGSRRAATGWVPCPPSVGSGRPALASTAGCPAAGRARGPVPVPAHVRPASTGDRAFAAIIHASGNGAPASFTGGYGGMIGLGGQLVTTAETWAARQGQAIRAQLCRSVPLPAGTACQ